MTRQKIFTRSGVALAGMVGLVTLAGCATDAAEAESQDHSSEQTPSTDSKSESKTSSPTQQSSAYVDGTYTAEGSYATPEDVETITVAVTLDNDIVTSVQISSHARNRESKEYEGAFSEGISAVVVGKNIDDLSVSRVAGASLTSDGFNKAIEQIKTEAAS